MMDSGKKLYFYQLLTGLTSIWIITMIGIIFINVKIFTDTKNDLLENISILSHSTNRSMLDNLEKNIDILHDLAEKIDEQVLASPEKSVTYFEEIREKYNYRNLSIATLEGISYTKDGNQVDLSERDYFQESLRGNSSISHLLSSKNDGMQVNVFSVPIIQEHSVVGVLWASMTSNDFYNILDIEELENFGEAYLVTENGMLVAVKDGQQKDENFFSFIEQTGALNGAALANIKRDFANGQDGYQRFVYDNKHNYMYYTQVPIYGWWILVNIPLSVVFSHAIQNILVITLTSFILLIAISVITLKAYMQIKGINKKILEASFVDTVTAGKNDVYLKYNLNKMKETDEKFAFIDLEICNINKLISILGVTSVQSIIKEKYYKLEGKLSPGEIITHGNLGRYNLLLKYKTTKSLLARIEQFNSINSSTDVIMGIYFIESKDISYERMYACTAIAKGNLLPGHNYGVYTKQLEKKENDQVKLEKDIDNAIEKQEFKAWFQPKYASDGKTLAGAEALVRWYKEDTIVSPYIFIPMCESSGKIKEIDMIVFEDVCVKISEWIRQGKQPVPISVNISRDYLDDLSFISHLENVMNIYDVPRRFIELEITESTAMENSNELKRVIDTLHNKGFKVSLDDFGVGYSSIKTMADFHFDTIKIDKSFVDGIGDKQWEDVIQYTINLSKQLNANVVAEGIENEKQYEFLVSCGCDILQGYYFGKPMATEDFMKLLSTGA